MPSISFKVDGGAIASLGNMIAAAGPKFILAEVRAVNHTGDKAKTAMRRALVAQTGLKYGTMMKAVKSRRAFNVGAEGAAYVIHIHGGNVALKYFKAKETRAGVAASPWNSRRVYAGTFIKGGRFPERVALAMGGQVFKRNGSKRFPIEKQKSGLFLPIEFAQGSSRAAFYATVEGSLLPRLSHELARVLG